MGWRIVTGKGREGDPKHKTRHEKWVKTAYGGLKMEKTGKC